MKKLIAIILLFAACTAYADVKALTWSGNNPPGSVNYVIEINRQNPANEDMWETLVVLQEENYTYEEFTFGRTYYRVWAETLTNDPETNEPIRSNNSSNVVSTVVRPNDSTDLGVGG